MIKHDRITAAVAVGLVVLLGFGPSDHVRAQDSHGQSSIHRDDPCDQLPDPPGKATGIAKHCPAGGSSSGVAKGDFNGDGFADMAIGVPEEDTGGAEDAGAVNVIYGSPTGLAADGSVPAPQFWSQNSTGISGSSQAGDRFGAALASGDFNDDGFSDLAIGIPGEEVTDRYAGRVVVIYGSPNGLSTDASVPASQAFDARSISRNPYPGLEPGGWDFGSALAWGDFNHDGIGDLAIGMPQYQAWFGVIGCGCTGGVWILKGHLGGGLTLNGNQFWVEKDVPGDADQRNSAFGTVLAAGDFNGDGFSDLAIGVPFYDSGICFSYLDPGCASGEVDVLYGGSSGVSSSNGSDKWSQASTGIAGTPEGFDHFGASLAVGDFNGDGRSDLAIGAPGETISGFVDTGSVEVVYGSSSGLTSSGSQFWDLNGLGGVYETGAGFGFALAAGDFNADGRADLAIGAPFKDVAGGAVNGGEVDVIYGSSTGLSKTSHPVQIWSQDSAGIAGGSESGDQFGASLTAWNFGRNEVSRISPLVPITSADLAIGVPHENIGSISDAGAVHVIYGSFLSNGLTSTGSQFWSQGSTGIPGGAEAGDHFGASMY
jgi:FG-GAP repeat protein